MPTHISPDFRYCMPYSDHQTDYAYTHITRLPVVHAIYWSPDWLCLHTYHQTSCGVIYWSPDWLCLHTYHQTSCGACHILITRLTMPTHISPDFLWCHILITRLTMPTHISPDFLHAIYWSPDWLSINQSILFLIKHYIINALSAVQWNTH